MNDLETNTYHHLACELYDLRRDRASDDAVYDSKTVPAFTGEHTSQILNYAMLLDVRHVKLLNVRRPRVQGKRFFNPITE